jgi:Ca-activated chloride channel family protein
MNKNEALPGKVGDFPAFHASAERKLIRPNGSHRHVLFTVKAPAAPKDKAREPLSLALVIDRSGSMSGEKIEMAKLATLKVIDKLDEADKASIVIFDNEVEVLLPMAPVSEQLKTEARSKLSRIEARANTALHEGWLTGCRSIASNEMGTIPSQIARCFLLTDGCANEGLTDPEQIASQAADVHKNTGICTSTFGIGTDYNEGLLGPMAIAGSGQFHHLRNPLEIDAAFGGELSDLFNVVARNVRVELELGTLREAELVSQYWVHPAKGKQHLVIDVGDLIANEERNLVMNLHFPEYMEGMKITVRARLLCEDNGSDYASIWQEMEFEAASHDTCDKERHDMKVMHWVGLHHAERAKKEALDLDQRGNLPAALHRLDGVIKRMTAYAKKDPDLMNAITELKALRHDLKQGAMTAETVRDVVYCSQMSSRGQRDHRSSHPF